MVDRRYEEFLRSIDFEFIRPGTGRGEDGRFMVERKDGSAATLLGLHRAPFDLLNTRLEKRSELYRALRPLLDVPRMGTFATGALINRGVERLRGSGAYVNVGVWNGFSLLCGMEGNPDTVCVGIDNFSQYADRSAAFMARFEARKGPAHRFHRMDYKDYFATQHQGPIGFYFYDGDHAYEHQVEGLEVAEPFFSEDCVVMVDDTNWGRARQATYDFLAQSEREYEVLFDVRTAHNQHPTFWNGVMVFQATGASRSKGDPPPRAPESRAGGMGVHATPPNRVDFDSRSTLVSLVVCEAEEGGTALTRTIEAALAQTWPEIEVLVVDTSSDGSVGKVLERFRDRVRRVVSEAAEPAARSGLEASNGLFVGLIDAATELDETAVEIGLTLPALSRFNRGTIDGPVDRARRALAAGRDIVSVIPPDASFVIAAIDFMIPESIDPSRAQRLFDSPRDALGEEDAIARLEDLRRRGVSHAAFFWEAFGWLEARPLFAEHIRKVGRPVLDNDRVRIVEFERLP
jgi:predicted O-methyltransferase YrrM